MALDLDTRQRAMLQEMGVHVWLPESGVVTLEQTVGARSQQSTSAQEEQRRTSQPSHQTNSEQATAASHPEARRAERSAQVKEEPTQWAGDTEQSAQPSAPPAQTGHATQAQTLPSADFSAASLDWPALADAVRNCQACGLCAARHQASIVPLQDAERCDWMVVGDPPDEDEDHTGAPFAGQDGMLLANMLRALGLQRANPLPGATQPAAASPAQRAYVSHVLKCRPAHGAVPKPAELAQCAAYLQREIALVQPKMILAMGRFANQLLLSDTPALATQPLGKLRGSVHRYHGTPVVVTYHPKVLMRNGADKAKAWADLCLAAETLTNRTD